MKSFFLGVLFFSLVSTTAFAGNGYWDYRTVCDYETIETSEPVTLCLYNGYLYGWSASNYTANIFSYTSTAAGHINCQLNVARSELLRSYNYSTQEWETIHYSGTLPLVSQYQTDSTTTSTQVIPGSCREERVWIPLCPTCEIP